jgi:hypothetical protein
LDEVNVKTIILSEVQRSVIDEAARCFHPGAARDDFLSALTKYLNRENTNDQIAVAINAVMAASHVAFYCCCGETK